MAEIVNLNRARKAKVRAGQQAQADANRQKFGRTKAEKEAEAARQALADRSLDGHRREE